MSSATPSPTAPNDFALSAVSQFGWRQSARARVSVNAVALAAKAAGTKKVLRSRFFGNRSSNRYRPIHYF